MSGDRVGIGWRPELAAGILSHLDQIDVVEVMADDLVGHSSREVRAFRTLAVQVPVVLHGVSLGLASCAPVDRKRLDAIARVVNRVEPVLWSEHLAFVRAGGMEIGHLAMPPRTPETIAGTRENLAHARRVVGVQPLVENVATLVEPPFSTLDEPEWVAQTLEQSGAGLLLDLHNLHSNAVNFGWPAERFFDRVPLERVGQVHLAGGRWVATPKGKRRLLDDHLHDVPDPVYALLRQLAARVSQPLTVVLERDGQYPPFEVLLTQLARAREALAQGRADAQLRRAS